MKRAVLFFMCMSMMLWSSYSFGYIIGYTRLYHPIHGITIDLVYDSPREYVESYWKGRYKPYRQAQKYLSKTERYLLDVLRAIDKSAQGTQTAVIWDAGEQQTWFDKACEMRFLMWDDWVERELSRISFIRGDITRMNFCIARKNFHFSNGPPVQVPTINFLLHKKYDSAEKMYGSSAVREFLNLCEQKNSNLKKLRPQQVECYSLSYKFMPVLIAFAEITDLEMMSHILTSPKKRIIVYARGMNAQGIFKMLTDFFDYEVLFRSISSDDFIWSFGTELDLNELSLLDT